MASATLIPNDPAPAAPYVLDAAGGASVSNTAAATLAPGDAALRYLDVVGAPRLRDLDLSDCAPDLHLSLSGCPRIERIHLPEQGEGAVLHLDAGARLPDLEILGPIDHLDACWQRGELAIGRGRARPFRGARLGTPTTFASSHELLVLADAGNPAACLTAADGNVRGMVLHTLSELRQLAVPAEVCLERLEIADCARLEHLDGAAAGRVVLRDCGALRRVAMSGHALRLHRCVSGGATLEIGGRWSSLSVIETSTPRLMAPGVDRVLVRDAPEIGEAELARGTRLTLRGDCRLRTDQLDAAVQLDDCAVTELLARAVAGDAAAERMLREWCTQPVSARQAFDTLRALARGAERFDAPELVWRLRCLLHAANRRKGAPVQDPLALAERDWHWRFPDDLAQEGWDADVRLWNHCRTWAPAARAGRVLIRGRALMPAVALAHVVGERPEEPDLRRQLVHALRHRARATRRARSADSEDEHHCWRLLQSAVALRDSEVADALVAMADRVLAAPVRLRLHAALIATGHTGARTAAMRLANDPNQRQELRSRAMATALGQARSEMPWSAT